MNIDERLEKLAERHQALAESMELANHQWDTRFRQVLEMTQNNANAAAALLETTRNLLALSEDHEKRVAALERERMRGSNT